MKAEVEAVLERSVPRSFGSSGDVTWQQPGGHRPGRVELNQSATDKSPRTPSSVCAAAALPRIATRLQEDMEEEVSGGWTTVALAAAAAAVTTQPPVRVAWRMLGSKCCLFPAEVFIRDPCASSRGINSRVCKVNEASVRIAKRTHRFPERGRPGALF